MQYDEAVHCGHKTRSGRPCTRSKGWGTDHPGVGYCSYAGGSTPTGKKHAARQEALSFARYALGAEAPVDPLDAQVLSVYLANGAVEFWRAKLHDEGAAVKPGTIEGYRSALADLNRFSKNAIESRVSERLLAITERQAEAVVMVCEAGLAAMIAVGAKLTNAQRTAFANGVKTALQERERPALPA